MMAFVKNQLENLFSGLTFLLPATVIIWILYTALNALENWGRSFLELFTSDQLFRGSGLILIIIILYLLGILLKRDWFTELLSKIPFLGIFFGGKNYKMMTIKKLRGLTPCTFLSSETCRKYAWILYNEKVDLDGEIFEGDIKIYVPNFPTIIFGEVCSVSKENAVMLGNTSDEVFNFILSTKEPENKKYMPWDKEEKQEFRKRLVRFNIIVN